VTTRRSRLNLSVAVTAVCVALCIVPSPADAAQPVPRVTPLATCTRPLSDGSWVAVFGYSVRTQTVTIPLGQKNYVSPSTVVGQPLTTFAPGTTASAFQVTVPANVASVTWVLQPAATPLTATLARPTGATTGTCSSSQISVIGGTWKSTAIAGCTTALLLGAYVRSRSRRGKRSTVGASTVELDKAAAELADLPVLQRS
jgi:hypothetical protein